MIKVLVVEDEEIIRNGLVYTIDWLKMDSVIVGTAEDGEEGLKEIHLKKPDVVITDIKMPILDGLEMISLAQKEQLDFEAILLTSYSDFDYAKRAIQLQIFDYLSKPVSNQKLEEVMKNVKEKVLKKREDQIAQAIYQQSKTGFNIDSIISSHFQNAYVNQAIRLINENYQHKLSLEQIAMDNGISTSYLSRVFKQETKDTFWDLLNKYRIQKAIELIKDGRMRIYEISEAVGFSDYKRFYSVFKKYANMSPTDFVKNSFFIVNDTSENKK